MPPWAISAIFTDISTAWERSFRSYETVQKADASVVLHDINEILRGASDLVEGHRAVFTPEEYSSFKAQHRTYQWMWFDEHRQYLKVKNDDANRLRDPSQLEADKEACKTRATNLLETVNTYRDNLLDASRRAAAMPPPAFPDEEPNLVDPHTLADTQANPPATQAIDPPAQVAPTLPDVPTLPQTTAGSSISRLASPARTSRVYVLPTNVGLMGRLMQQNAFDSRIGARTAERSADRAFVEGQGFGFAVAHIAHDPGSGVGAIRRSTSTSKIYRRMISVKLGNEQIEIPDPALYDLEPHEVVPDKKALAAALPVIQNWLKSIE
ncbi:hypothetical protein FS749_013428 [Ceratobasidium sp. UAMH 11750]|nr:hypothetical protein FS749_013428 [Ceratobasidium sp. UAMH 11750]